ncbi:MAG: hypothetical protein JWO33_2802 [Caulobacteraceae bacterium]|nr:hypothetical protein [Caulobacteraceae bacterium]
MQTPEEAARIVLPKAMSLTAAAPLASRLTSLQGAPIVLDASQVERLGGLCLQVLLSASVTWRAAGVPFEIDKPSSAFTEAWTLFAAPPLAAAA